MRLVTSSRSHWTVVGCCLLAVVASTVAAVSHESAAQAVSASKADSAPATPTAAATGPAHTLSFGMAYGNTLLEQPQETLDSRLDDAVALGDKWIRVDLPWSSVQPSRDSGYDWSEFDMIAEAAYTRGLKIDATLDDVPGWARESTCSGSFYCPPADDEQFAQFAAAAAEHYAPLGMNTWEIWNEPNIQSWAPAPDPAAYEKLLATTAEAIRAVKPDAFILLGGLAAPDPVTAIRMSPFVFLTDVARLGGTKYVNAIGYHPYSSGLPNAAPTFAMISSSPQNLESVLQRYGTPNVQIWLNETGKDVPNERTDVAGTSAVSKTEEQFQSSYAVNLVQTVAANSYVAADFWYSDTDDTQFNLEYGVRRADGSYRPVFSTLKEAIADCGCNSGR